MPKKIKQLIFYGILLLLFPVIAQGMVLSVDELWEWNNKSNEEIKLGYISSDTWNTKLGTYLEPAFTSGRGLLIKGQNKYINFSTSYGSSGYGIRDNSGTLQIKNNGGSWSTITTGGGIVTSVAMSVPTGLTITGSPITTSGTLALTLTGGYQMLTDTASTTWDGKWDALSDMTLATGNVYMGNASNNPIATSSFYISPTGCIGIGTTTACCKLCVDGNIRTTDTFYGNTWASYTGNSMAIQPTSDTDDYFSFKTPAHRPTIKREGGKFIYFDSSNVYDVGISLRDDDTYSGTLNYEKDGHLMTMLGKASPLGFKANSDYDDYIKIQTASNIPEITVASSSAFKINAGGTNSLLLNHSGGYVGIGTTSPLSQFSMNSGTNGFRIDSSGIVQQGTWQGTAIADTYVANDITANNYLGLSVWYATTTHALILSLPSLATVGTITSGIWQATDVGVSYGGTGLSDPTDHCVLVGSGGTAITALAEGGDGMLLIGDTANDPVFATLTCDNGLTCTTGAGTLEIDADTASDTVDGVVELATTAETTTGTDATRAITPDGLAGSIFGEKNVETILVASDTANAAATSTYQRIMPVTLNGMNITDAICGSQNVSTSTVRLVRNRAGTEVYVFSTNITVTGERYATDETINTSNDDIQTGDIFYWVILASATPAGNGLTCSFTAKLP